MPTAIQYETVKQQCLAFESLGFKTELGLIGGKKDGNPAITLSRMGKTYKFADIDWDVVIRQMAYLYNKVKSYPHIEFSQYVKSYNIKY